LAAMRKLPRQKDLTTIPKRSAAFPSWYGATVQTATVKDRSRTAKLPVVAAKESTLRKTIGAIAPLRTLDMVCGLLMGKEKCRLLSYELMTCLLSGTIPWYVTSTHPVCRICETIFTSILVKARAETDGVRLFACDI
jgi:hypothetical protein